MYIIRKVCLEQFNMTVGLSGKPGMDLCVRWLNPPVNRCNKTIVPG
jgi:hypothetical protein